MQRDPKPPRTPAPDGAPGRLVPVVATGVALGKAVLSGLPIIGGPLASLISDAQAEIGKRSVDRLIGALQAEINALGDRIDTVETRVAEFAELFATCSIAVVRTTSEDRIRTAARILASARLRTTDPESAPYSELDHFARCVEQLPAGAFEVLRHAYAGVRPDPRGSLPGDMQYLNFDSLSRSSPGQDAAFTMAMVNALDAANLLHSHGRPGIATADYGNYRLERTRLGMRFVSHVTAAGGA